MVFRVLHVRRLLAWVVTACFVAVTLCGEGLHLLPGFGHGCRHSCGHVCQGQDSNCDYAASVASGHESDDELDAADCPVCNYFAAAKGLPALGLPETGHKPVAGAAAVLDSLISRCTLSAYHSRAPPLG